MVDQGFSASPRGFLSNLDQVRLTLGEFSSTLSNFWWCLELIAFTYGLGYLSFRYMSLRPISSLQAIPIGVLEQYNGLEPSTSPWKGEMLPLHQYCIFWFIRLLMLQTFSVISDINQIRLGFWLWSITSSSFTSNLGKPLSLYPYKHVSYS